MNRRITWTHKCSAAGIAIGIAALSATYGLSWWQVPETPPLSNLGGTYTMRSISSEQLTLVERIRSSASGSNERKEMREQLKTLVGGELDQRLANQATELAHIERRLVEAKAKLAQGTVNRNEIVERRVNQLLQEPDELEWANTIATQPSRGLLPNEGSYQRVGAGDETVPVTSMNANQNSAVSAMPPSSYEHAIRSLPQENTSSEHFPTVGATSVSKQAADLQNEALEVEATFDAEFIDLVEKA